MTAGASATGFEPDNPWGYSLDPSDVPPVAIPDVSGVPGAFDPGNDPYDAYAVAVIAALADDVVDGKVAARADFVAQVTAWRANDKAIAKALAASMNISQAETSAFLKAENKVTAYVQTFMDAQDWFKDSTVPPDVRATVDGVLKNKFDMLADQMKEALNDLDPNSGINLEHLFMTTLGFGAAMAVVDVATPYFEMMATLVQATERVAVGFVPFVGPTLDFCEAVTGRAWCMPDGEELSTEQRIFSGAGVALSSAATFWGGVKNAGIGAKGAVVAEDIAKVPEELVAGVRANPGKLYGPLRGAVASTLVNDAEKAAGKALADEGHWFLGLGDDGVRDVLDIPASSKPGTIEGRACDFLTISPGGKICLTEVKAGLSNVDDLRHGLDQLTNTAASVQKKGLLGKLERVQLALPKGTKLPGSYGVKDGYLIRTLNGKVETIRLEGISGANNVFVRIKWL